MAGRNRQTRLHQEERTPRVIFCPFCQYTVEVLLFLSHQAAPIGSFYRRSTTSLTQEPNTLSDNSLYWHPGVPLPVGRASTPGPTHHPPFYPMVHQPQVSDESDDDLSVQSALKAILVSQTSMQKKMEEIFNRVDKLESSAKDTSLSSSSSSDDRKRKRRLPSDLCVGVSNHL